MNNLDVLALSIFCFVMGAVAMWLWTRADVIHYKDLYLKVRSEKKALMEDYSKRLDELSKFTDNNTETLFETDTEPLVTCEGHSEQCIAEYC